jgi:segregation and condensation protein A
MLEQIIDGSSGTIATDGTWASYIVQLPIFEGPLDLLLHLIEKRQMEITTVSLVAVTDQYLAYIRRWQEAEVGSLPLANMAAFISISARLLFIKSQSLLPRISKEEVDEQAKNAAAMAEELRRHLLEYKQAKEIARHLRQREEAGLQTYARSSLLASIEAQLAWTPPTLIGMEPQSLASAFQRLLELRTKDELDGADLIPLARITISERTAEIVRLLHERTCIFLAELIEKERSHLVVIVTFLAVLEMWKRERITVTQDSLFGSICLQRGPCWFAIGQDDEQEGE